MRLINAPLYHDSTRSDCLSSLRRHISEFQTDLVYVGAALDTYLRNMLQAFTLTERRSLSFACCTDIQRGLALRFKDKLPRYTYWAKSRICLVVKGHPDFPQQEFRIRLSSLDAVGDSEVQSELDWQISRAAHYVSTGDIKPNPTRRSQAEIKRENAESRKLRRISRSPAAPSNAGDIDQDQSSSGGEH